MPSWSGGPGPGRLPSSTQTPGWVEVRNCWSFFARRSRARPSSGCSTLDRARPELVRIVAGSARGTRLAPVPAGTRPVSDRAREGLFSSLGARVEGARVLDLFAGTGAMGIEALSRGAVGATFVDASVEAIRTIKENLRGTGVGGGATVRRSIARRAVRGIPGPFELV